MFDSRTALLVVDAQESFRHRPYWNNNDAPEFIARLQELIDGARAGGIPVVQIFHVDDEGVFSLASGHVKTIAGLSITPDATFHKHSHSALVGSGLDVWLVNARDVKNVWSVPAFLDTGLGCQLTEVSVA